VRCTSLSKLLGPPTCHPVGEPPLNGFDEFSSYFSDKIGLEIGGPSTVFASNSILPLYGWCKNVDNCNFSSETIWQGRTGQYERGKLRQQFTCEATQLEAIKDEIYDFVIASHLLEHIANPTKALYEWKRVLKAGGALLLVCPNRQATFDHSRPVTKIENLLDDYRNNTDESDLTHLQEVLELHDLSMDPMGETFENFVVRCRDNLQNRCLHHHVFDTELIVEMLSHVCMKAIFGALHGPHIVVLSEKTTNLQGQIISSNLQFLESLGRR
jgi:predicted SAM-dependent methyltransferase